MVDIFGGSRAAKRMRNAAMAREPSFYAAAERRIEYFTVGAGNAPVRCARELSGEFALGSGVASGAALSWINYRWMKQGVNALARSCQAAARRREGLRPAERLFQVYGPLHFADRRRVCYPSSL